MVSRTAIHRTRHQGTECAQIKHNIVLHFVQDLVKAKRLKIHYVRSGENIMDFFTKDYRDHGTRS